MKLDFQKFLDWSRRLIRSSKDSSDRLMAVSAGQGHFEARLLLP